MLKVLQEKKKLNIKIDAKKQKHKNSLTDTLNCHKRLKIVIQLLQCQRSFNVYLVQWTSLMSDNTI